MSINSNILGFLRCLSSLGLGRPVLTMKMIYKIKTGIVYRVNSK